MYWKQKTVVETGKKHIVYPGRENLWNICQDIKHPELQKTAREILGYHRFLYTIKEVVRSLLSKYA